nr:EOG090X05XL [Scapholeberis mucronata]
MATLFDGDSSEDEGQLKINSGYAEKYNQWREKEEYQKLKDKYGEAGAMRMIADEDEGSSSTSESEDEDGEAWDVETEKQFFKTLASLKKKDPSIYNSEKKFFNKDGQPVLPKKTSKDLPFTLRDYERKVILEKGGRMSDEEEDRPQPTFREEQEQLKKSFKCVLQDSDSEAEDLLKIRPKSDAQREKEEEEYREWLKGRKNKLDSEETVKELEPLKQYWSDPKLDENEKFLKDFFLNKRYKSSEDKSYIPTYDEIVCEPEEDLSEDEKILEKQMEFEHKYNFRFEEPDPEFIKRYPRTIKDSLRRPDTSRKKLRDQVKERKIREKEEKKEELKMLKKYKLKEIQEKLEQLKTITGNQSLPFQDDDLEGDFDPEKYDQKMGEIFNQDYYHVEDDDQKPEFPYDPEIDDENWDNYTGPSQNEPSTSNENYDDYDEYDGPHCEDPDFNMDCDYEDTKENTRKEMIELSRRSKGRKKSIFAQKLEAKKPVFDPTQYPNYEEYLEEYYKLDYEDIIGDQPVRFKYRTVLSNDFGLDTEEILAARDKELNQWCSVKKMSQYRTEMEERQDFYTYKTKKQNQSLKRRMLPSIFAENPEELMVEDQEKDRKKRRRNQGKEEDPDPNLVVKPHNSKDVSEEPVPIKKKRKNKGKELTAESVGDLSTTPAANVDQGTDVPAEMLERKKDKKLKRAAEAGQESQLTEAENTEQTLNEGRKSKKKKKTKDSNADQGLPEEKTLEAREQDGSHSKTTSSSQAESVQDDVTTNKKKKKKMADANNDSLESRQEPIQVRSPSKTPNDSSSKNSAAVASPASVEKSKKNKKTQVDSNAVVKPTFSNNVNKSGDNQASQNLKKKKKKNKKKKKKNKAAGEQTTAERKVDPKSKQIKKNKKPIKTPCCNKVYTCRFCHDEKEDHTLNRKNVDEIMCSVCETKQPVQQHCSNCGILFGQYFCGKCKLIDDEDKKQYHCEGCGICRVGGRDKFFHCQTCDMCLPKKLENQHRYWRILDDEIASTPMPVEYQNYFVTILCNDCHKFSEVPMHPLGAKCQNAPCGSYNTCRSGGPVNRPAVREPSPNTE